MVENTQTQERSALEAMALGNYSPMAEPSVQEPVAQAQVIEQPIAQESTQAPVVVETKNESQVQAQATKSTDADLNPEYAKMAELGFKTADDLKPILDKVNSYTALETKYNEAEKTLSDYKAKEATSPFANDYIAKLNELTLGGASKEQIETFAMLNQVGDFASMNPYEARKMASMLRDGLTAKEAEHKLSKLYPALRDEDASDEDKASASTDLSIDAKADINYLKQQKIDVSISQSTKNEQALVQQEEQRIADVKTKLQPIAENIAKTMEYIKDVAIKGKDGIKVDIPISKEFQKNIPSFIEDYVIRENIPLNTEGVAHLQEVVQNYAILENKEAIFAHLVNVTEERMRNEFNNPSAINREQVNPNVITNQVTEQRKALERMASGSY